MPGSSVGSAKTSLDGAEDLRALVALGADMRDDAAHLGHHGLHQAQLGLLLQHTLPCCNNIP